MSNLNLNDGKFRSSINGIENGRTSQVSGVNSILNEIVGNTNYLKNEVDKKTNSSISITAGNGLDGGGDLSANRTINVVSKNDGIIINPNDIQLNTYDGVDNTSATRPASAGAVKKAYDKSVEAENSIGNKLDKGGYQGTAQDLKNAIDKKVSKNGDTMTGTLTINIDESNGNNSVILKNKNKLRAILGCDNNSFFIYDETYGRILDFNSGDLILKAQNLKTIKKDMVGAINELKDNEWKINWKNIGSQDLTTDLDTINEDGYYLSSYYYNKFKHLPDGVGGAFMLIVGGLSSSSISAYRIQYLRDYRNNKMFTRVNNAGPTEPAMWTDWVEILTQDSNWFLGTQGLEKLHYIQDNKVKEEGKGYIDKTTGKPYRCIKQAPVNIITPNAEYFVPADNISNSKHFTKKTLYTGKQNTGPTNGNITLNDSLNNYDMIIVYFSDAGLNQYNQGAGIYPVVIDVDTLKEIKQRNLLGIVSQGDVDSANQSQYVTLSYVNNTTLYCTYNSNSIYSIVGIRY